MKTTWRLAEQGSYNWGYKEEAMLRLVEEVEMRKRLVPHPRVVKNQDRFFAMQRIPLRIEGSEPHTGLPNPPVLGRGFPTISGCENQQGFHLHKMKGWWTPRYSLKGPKHRLIYSQTFILSSKDSTMKSARDTLGGTELSGFRTRTGGAVLSKTKVPLFLVKPCPHIAKGASWWQIWVSINLADTTLAPPRCFSETLFHPIHMPRPNIFQRLHHTSSQLGPVLRTFLKFLKGSLTLNKYFFL